MGKWHIGIGGYLFVAWLTYGHVHVTTEEPRAMEAGFTAAYWPFYWFAKSAQWFFESMV